MDTTSMGCDLGHQRWQAGVPQSWGWKGAAKLGLCSFTDRRKVSSSCLKSCVLSAAAHHEVQGPGVQEAPRHQPPQLATAHGSTVLCRGPQGGYGTGASAGAPM